MTGKRRFPTMKSTNPVLGHRSLAVPIHGVVVLGLALVSSYFAYLWGTIAVNPADVLAPFLFWYGVAFLLFAYPLRSVIMDFPRQVKTAFGASVFALYMVVHVLLYGFLLEGILGTFGRLYSATSASFTVSTTVFTPPSPVNALLALWYNPWVTLTIPPNFDTDLSLYSLVIAVVIDILIVANIAKARELGKACSTATKSRAIVLFPALGIAFGASCCLSAPLLFTIAVPSVAALSSLLWAYDATYFLFPPFAVFLLYLNYRSVQRIMSNIKLSLSDVKDIDQLPDHAGTGPTGVAGDGTAGASGADGTALENVCPRPAPVSTASK